MKRIIAILGLLVVLATGVQAQGFIVKGGISARDKYDGWSAGIGYQTFSREGFSIQPELYYRNEFTSSSVLGGSSSTRSSIELPVNVQWGIDLLVAKPFIFAGPYATCHFDCGPSEPRFDFGGGAGVGVNIWYLQLAAKYNWSFNAPFNRDCWEFSLGIKF